MNGHWTRILIALTLILTLALAGACPRPAEPVEPVPRTFVDDLGRTVTIEKIPQRIVSVAPSNTEILFVLGLGDRIVGVTEWCNYPEAALDIEKVGGFVPFDLERVVVREPDLVLAAGIHHPDGIAALEEVGITVFALAPKTLGRVLANIALVGEITGKSEEAIRLVTDLEERIEAITARTQLLTDEQRPRVLHLVWHDPLWVAGSGTFADDLIIKAGGKNIAHDLVEWAVIDLETVIARDPEVIIATHGAAGVKDDPRLAATTAGMEDRVYLVEEDPFQRPGPRLVDALEVLAGLLQPELFPGQR
ncbi:helical backbone metal receptor [Dehalococcoidia bacterium]|nr:helical backbone metal receptor [Dehalococcoidia bacterium]